MSKDLKIVLDQVQMLSKLYSELYAINDNLSVTESISSSWYHRGRRDAYQSALLKLDDLRVQISHLIKE